MESVTFAKDGFVANNYHNNSTPLLNNFGNTVTNDITTMCTETSKLAEAEEKPDVTGKPKALDGGRGWFIVFGSFLSHVLVGGLERSKGVFYLQLLDRYQMSATATSWVLSMCSSILFVAGPIVSMLCNKLSCRVVAFLGALLSVIGILVSGFAPNLFFLYFSYGLLEGIGRGLAYGPSLIIVGYYFDRKMGIAVGLATAGTGFGSFLFPPLMEKLFEQFDFLGAFIILAGLASHLFICAAAFRPLDIQERNNQKLPINQEATQSLETGETESSTKLQYVKSVNKACKQRKKSMFEFHLLKNYAFVTTCIQIFFHAVSQHVTIVFLPALAMNKDIGPIQRAALLSVIGVCDAVSRVVISSVLDLKPVKKYRLLIYNSLIFFTGVASAVYPLMTSFWQFVVVSAIYGLLSGSYISQKSVVVVDILGVENLSSSVGLLLLFQGIGSFVGPTLGALYKDSLGGYDMAFYLGAIGLLIGGFIMATGNVWLHLQKNNKKLFDSH